MITDPEYKDYVCAVKRDRKVCIGTFHCPNAPRAFSDCPYRGDRPEECNPVVVPLRVGRKV